MLFRSAQAVDDPRDPLDVVVLRDDEGDQCLERLLVEDPYPGA